MFVAGPFRCIKERRCMQDKKVYFYSLALVLFFVGFNLHGMYEHKKTLAELFEQYDAIQKEKRAQREEDDNHRQLMKEVYDVLEKAETKKESE